MGRRAEMAPSPAKSRVSLPTSARGTAEFGVESLSCFGTLVNVESL